MRRLILIPLVALLCFPATAQRGFSGARAGTRFSAGFSPNHRGRHVHSVGYPFGSFFGDSLFYPDELADAGDSAPVQPVIVIPQAPGVRVAPVPFPEPPEPLLIEFRGGRYVQVSGVQNSSEEAVDQPAGMTPSRTHASEAAQTSDSQLSTLLVFRDGAREEIHNYTIADGFVYIQTNYYNDGSWHKQLAVSSLDLAATMRENRARGVQFRLPAAANEVIVGP